MKIKIATVGMILIGMMACGDSATSPGTGPGFPSDVTAIDLFGDVSDDNPYAPSPLFDGDHYSSGTVPCDGGGKVTVEDERNGNRETADFTYEDCFNPGVQIKSGLALSQNGTIRLTIEKLHPEDPDSEVGTYTFEHHMSYSGDIGFAEDCNMTLTITSDTELSPSTFKFEGECTYVDSKGKVLKLTGDDINALLF